MQEMSLKGLHRHPGVENGKGSPKILVCVSVWLIYVGEIDVLEARYRPGSRMKARVAGRGGWGQDVDKEIESGSIF